MRKLTEPTAKCSRDDTVIGTVFYPIWCCAITAATLVVGINMQPSEPVEGEMQVKEEPAPVYYPPQLLVAPVVNDNKSVGYIFSNISLEMDSSAKPKSKVPLQMVMQDAYLSLIVGNPKFNFPYTSQFELLEFRAGLKSRINEAMGTELVRSLYVSGINFLGKDEARTKQTFKSVWLQETPESGGSADESK